MKRVFLITKIRSDHGGELDGGELDSMTIENFCEENDFYHDFSPLLNNYHDFSQGLLNKRVWALQEFARPMLNEYDLPKYFFLRKPLISPVIFQIEF